MPLTPARVKELCRESLPQIGIEPDQIQNGVDFYKFLFTNHPDLRTYFKGAENYTAEQVQRSDRFTRLGNGMLLSNHVLVEVYDDPMIFKVFVQDLIEKHKE
uniref:Globin family profile domain-containing protein n=1 Tax=Panagrolaimus sp. JU765 TaxID=591449 RepID=A0AC34QE20_9BILA